MKSMMQPKKGYIVAYYAKNPICKEPLFTCARAAHTKCFIIFVVMNQI